MIRSLALPVRILFYNKMSKNFVPTKFSHNQINP
jgi:hypothetical protein